MGVVGRGIYIYSVIVTVGLCTCNVVVGSSEIVR